MLNNCTALDNRSDDRYRSEHADRALPTGRIEVRRGCGGSNKNLIDCKRSISVRPHLICRRLSVAGGWSTNSACMVRRSTVLYTSLPREPAIDALYVTNSTPFATNAHVGQVLADVRPGDTSQRRYVSAREHC